jgi:hypothetical protein
MKHVSLLGVMIDGDWRRRGMQGLINITNGGVYLENLYKASFTSYYHTFVLPHTTNLASDEAL